MLPLLELNHGEALHIQRLSYILLLADLHALSPHVSLSLSSRRTPRPQPPHATADRNDLSLSLQTQRGSAD